MIGRPKFVLASGSPRRLALINQAGIEPDALKPADIDESPRRGEIPRAHANRLARTKAELALANVKLDDELRGAYILAADTVVAVGRRILPKAELLAGGGAGAPPADGGGARRGGSMPASAIGPQSPRPYLDLPGDPAGGVPSAHR